MARQTLVDGFNLIHAVPRLSDLAREQGPPAAVRALITTLVRWAGVNPRAKVVLVCDGVRPKGVPMTPPARGLSVRFADDADSDLLELLRRKGSRSLVSGDGELVRAAKNVGADVVAPRAWFEAVIDELGAAGDVARKVREVPDHEVDEWLETFGAPRPRPPQTPPSEGLPPEAVQEWLEYFGEGE